MSDVPLGTFLSGGIDSSVVTALAVQHQQPLHTFQITYPRLPQFNEAVYGTQVANSLQTQHHAIPLDSQSLQHFAKKLLSHIDHPFADSSAIAMYALCHYAKQEVTVALSGDGGDEVFAGYEKHRGLLAAQRFKISTILATPLKELLGYLPKSRHSRVQNYIRKLHRLLELYGKSTKGAILALGFGSLWLWLRFYVFKKTRFVVWISKLQITVFKWLTQRRRL